VALNRGFDGSDPFTDAAARVVDLREERRIARSGRLASGTLACPRCDAPVAPAGPVTPAQPLGCPYCEHAGAVRDFLTLGEPTRPARVVVRVHRRR
jgi:hypothetical protein